jgi:4a-hydroxytetrahydrobiopterin dehydratase
MQLTKKLTEESKRRLEDKHCVPCEGGVPALDEATAKLLLDEVSGWTLRANGAQPEQTGQADQPAQIGKRFEFADFLGAMAFVDKMAALAEQEGHHPDFCVHYSRVDVTLWTHAARGLSENDFILASKPDAIVS